MYGFSLNYAGPKSNLLPSTKITSMALLTQKYSILRLKYYIQSFYINIILKQKKLKYFQSSLWNSEMVSFDFSVTKNILLHLLLYLYFLLNLSRFFFTMLVDQSFCVFLLMILYLIMCGWNNFNKFVKDSFLFLCCIIQYQFQNAFCYFAAFHRSIFIHNKYNFISFLISTFYSVFESKA